MGITSHSLKMLLVVAAGIILSFQPAATNTLQAQIHPTPNTHTAQEHSADVALRWSILPGGGQVYNKQAWKVPIIYGAFAGMGYFIHRNYNNMKMFKDEYLYRVANNGASSLEGYENYSTDNIYSLYNSYNRDFQLMIIITVGIYALNLIDAYVFGHLFDFQMDDNISLAPSLMLTPQGLAPAVGFSFSM